MTEAGSSLLFNFNMEGADLSFDIQPELVELAGRAPGRAQSRLVRLLWLLILSGYVGIHPFVEALVSQELGIVALQSAGLAITHLLIALLLIGQLQLRRSLAVSILSGSYLVSSIAACAYTLLFPELISLSRSIENAEFNDWLYLSWHGTFSSGVLAYALTSMKPSRKAMWRQLATLLLIIALVCTGLSTGLEEVVPALAADRRSGNVYSIGTDAVILVSVVALAALIEKQPRTLLDLWLSVTMLTWIFDIALASSFDNQSFDLGFYVGRLCSVFGSLLMLGILGIENLRVHARLRSAFDDMIEARARQKSNDMLAAVLRKLPEGIFIFDGSDEPIVNERGMALIGRDLAVAGNAGFSHGTMDLVMEQGKRAVEEGAFEDRIMETTGENGKRIYSVSAAAIQDREASAVKVVVINDVTERIQADQVLRQYLDRLHALLENTPLAAIEWGVDRIVRRWSKRAEDLFGWPASAVVGQRADTFGFIHPDDLGTIDAMANALVRTKVSYIELENRNITRDGRVLECEWHNSALRNEHGEIETVFSLALDITERKRAMAQLQEADQRKDVFIATLAHELRNPLAPIANAASLLLSQGADPKRVEWIASMIGRQSARMGRLLDDLLDVSRISRGKIELRREQIDMTNLVHETLQVSMPLIETAHHALELHMPQGPVWVNGDPVRIAQIISNLVNNAAKYTPPGGRIEVCLDASSGSAVFTVRDDGIGIEPGMLEHIFEAFVQVGAARHLAQGGLGIGLSLAQGFAQLHGGSLRVASDGKGRGSTFVMSLPLAPGKKNRVEMSSAPVSKLTLASTILVADDNVDAADSLSLLLRGRGANVVVAYDGEQALKEFYEHHCDIVILDLGMPNLDGLAVARQLAKADPKPFLVALTGRGRKEDHAESMLAGFDEHLIKPVDMEQLSATLQRACRVS
jgi:PAS domain S-box-containing protein